MFRSIRVAVLEQQLAGQLPQAFHQTCQPRIRQGHVFPLPRLAPEAEAQATATHRRDMPISQRGQAVGPIAACVLGIADADQGGAQHRNHHRYHLFAGKARDGQRPPQRASQLGGAAPNAMMRASFSRPRRLVHSGWQRYCLRPRASRPVACRWSWGSRRSRRPSMPTGLPAHGCAARSRRCRCVVRSLRCSGSGSDHGG